MVRQTSNRQCQHCQGFFDPDPRHVGRQHDCTKPPCRQASKAARQGRWLRTPANQDDFRGPAPAERVRQWRQAPPGYWRRKAAQAQEVLQEPLTLQELEKQEVEESMAQPA